MIDSNVRSLAAVRAGESIRVRRILYQDLRSHYRNLGINEGDVVQCRSAGEAIVLRVSDHHTVVLDHDAARFVEISAVNARPAWSMQPQSGSNGPV